MSEDVHKSEAVDPGGDPTGEEIAAAIEAHEAVAEPVVEIDSEPPDNLLALAIAAHFGVEPENVTGFAAVVEYTNENGENLSSAWSAATPVWRLRAFARELLVHLGGV